MIDKKRNFDQDDQDDLRVMLIDFGLATNYLDEDGKHCRKEYVENFKGNLLFASLSTLQFYRPSRKDDFISLCYLMIFLFNKCEMPFLVEQEPQND